MPDFKTYIRGVDLDERVRSELVFSNTDKIRMYPDFRRPGVRLKGTFNKWSRKIEFPLDTDLTVRLPSWTPRAVKQWFAFQEHSVKPDGTSIGWRVSDGTDDYWLEPVWPADLLVLFQYNDLTPSFALDYFRDGSSPVITTIGSPSIVDPGVTGFGAGALGVGGGGTNGVLYTGGQVGAAKNTGTTRFRIKPNYSGSPALEQTIYYSYEAAGFKNIIILGHGVTGEITSIIGDDTGGSIFFGTLTNWNPTAGTWYEFELVWDTTPGTGFGFVLRIDGVTFFSDSSTGSRSAGSADTYGFGTTGPEVSDFVIDEIHIYHTVKHVADYVPETSEFEPSRIWVVVTPLDTEWNTDVEVTANIPNFPFTQRTIQLVANLVTTNKHETPILRSFDLAILAQFDYWEDLILRSLVPRLRTDFQFIVDFSAEMIGTLDNFNVKDGNTEFTPDKGWDVIGIDSVYNEVSDPDHDIDLLDSFDVSSGKVTMTGQLITGTRVFIRMKIQPDIIVNFAHVDYIEVAKTPAVIIESVAIRGRKVVAFREIVDLAAEKGYQLQKPFHAETVTLVCSMLVGGVTDSLRMLSTSMGAIMAGEQSGQLPCVLNTVALGERITMMYDNTSRYNPRPNYSHLMTSTFGIILKNFYVWSEDVKEKDIVKEFKFSPIIDADVDGPEPIGDPKPLNAGVISFLLNEPDFEDG